MNEKLITWSTRITIITFILLVVFQSSIANAKKENTDSNSKTITNILFSNVSDMDHKDLVKPK